MTILLVVIIARRHETFCARKAHKAPLLPLFDLLAEKHRQDPQRNPEPQARFNGMPYAFCCVTLDRGGVEFEDGADL